MGVLAENPTKFAKKGIEYDIRITGLQYRIFTVIDLP